MSRVGRRSPSDDVVENDAVFGGEDHDARNGRFNDEVVTGHLLAGCNARPIDDLIGAEAAIMLWI